MAVSKREYDVFVIGTGAGDGVMVDQLTAAGFEVVAIERGGRVGPIDFDDDELRYVIRDEVFRRTSVKARLRSFPSGSSLGAPRHSASNEKWILSFASGVAPPQGCSVKLEFRPPPNRSIAAWPKSALAR